MVKDAVRHALLEERVFTCAPVQTELLVGAKDEAALKKLTELLEGLYDLPVEHSTWNNAAKLGFRLRRQGLSVPLPDLLIAQVALHHALTLWHLDEHYELMREHTGLQTKSFLAS